MNKGKLLFAEGEGHYVLKAVGELRVTYCSALDAFFDKLAASDDFSSLVIDLSEATTVDSTTLGLFARFAIRTQDEKKNTPVILSTEGDITRILHAMGFDSIFVIVDRIEGYDALDLNMSVISQDAHLEHAVHARKVLEAHKTLMLVNEDNRKAFSELVKHLESLQSAG